MTAQSAGAALVTAACFWGGWKRRQWYVCRRRTLSAFCHAFARMEAELSCGDTDTWMLVALLEQGQAGRFFRTLSRRRGELESFPFAALWKDALAGQHYPLKEEETALLERAGQVLGRYDGRTQAFLLSQLRRELEGMLENARREEQRMGRTVVILGLSLGLGISVLLI